MSDWGDAISAAGAAIQNVSNAFAGKLNFKDNLKLMHESWKYNDWVRTEQNGFNAKQAWLARQFADQQRIAQNVYSEAMYNKYSSPEAMVRQLQAAGLNPRLAMGSQNAGSISASSGSSGGGPAASGSAIAGAAPPYIQDLNYQSNGFLNVANSLKALAEAKNLGVDTEFAEQSLKDRLKQVQLSNSAQELANSINEVVYRYLPEKERRRIELMIQDFSTGELKMDEIRANLFYLEQRGLLTKKEYDTFDERFAKEMAKTEAETHAKDSEADLNYSNKLVATYRVFEIEQNIKESEAREEFFRSNAGYMKVNKEFIQIQKDILEGSKNQKIAYDKEYWVKQKENLTDLQKQLRLQIELAKKDKDWYNVRALTDILNKTAQTVQTVQAIQYKPAEFLSSFLGN